MTERTAIRIVKMAPVIYLASMALPTWMDPSPRGWGLQVAYFTLHWALMGAPVCIAGALGNILFLLTAALVLTRLVRG